MIYENGEIKSPDPTSFNSSSNGLTPVMVESLESESTLFRSINMMLITLIIIPLLYAGATKGKISIMFYSLLSTMFIAAIISTMTFFWILIIIAIAFAHPTWMSPWPEERPPAVVI